MRVGNIYIIHNSLMNEGATIYSLTLGFPRENRKLSMKFTFQRGFRTLVGPLWMKWNQKELRTPLKPDCFSVLRLKPM